MEIKCMRVLSKIDPELLETFEKLGISLSEQEDKDIQESIAFAEK